MLNSLMFEISLALKIMLPHILLAGYFYLGQNSKKFILKKETTIAWLAGVLFFSLFILCLGLNNSILDNMFVFLEVGVIFYIFRLMFLLHKRPKDYRPSVHYIFLLLLILATAWLTFLTLLIPAMSYMVSP